MNKEEMTARLIGLEREVARNWPANVTKEMVDRFLTWPLPKSVRPDPCVTNPDYPHRVGTNLLSADEARQMLEHVLRPELPKYKCHKTVHALKIDRIETTKGEQIWITPLDHPFAPFKVDSEWFNKHKPQVGGYYVIYDDGYTSYSPAKAFEEGYTRITHP